MERFSHSTKMSTFNDTLPLRPDASILADLLPGEHLVDSAGNVSLLLVNNFQDLIRWFYHISHGKWDFFKGTTLPATRKMVRKSLDKCYVTSRRHERSLVFFALKKLMRYLDNISNWVEYCRGEIWSSTDEKDELNLWDRIFTRAKGDDDVEDMFMKDLTQLDAPFLIHKDDGEWTELKPKHPPPPPPSLTSEEEEEQKNYPPPSITESSLLDPSVASVTLPASPNVFVTEADSPADPIWKQYESWPVIYDKEHMEDNRDTPKSRALREEIMNRMIVIEETNFVDQMA